MQSIMLDTQRKMQEAGSEPVTAMHEFARGE